MQLRHLPDDVPRRGIHISRLQLWKVLDHKIMAVEHIVPNVCRE